MNTLPFDDPLRIELHNEVHARPTASIHLPAFIVLVGVFNSGISREQEWVHLKRLQPDLLFEEIQGNFVRLSLGANTLKWERHTEFTRYSLVQALPPRLPNSGIKLMRLRSTIHHAVHTRSQLKVASMPPRTIAAMATPFIGFSTTP